MVELEVSHTDSDGGDDSSDINLATVEIGIDAQLNDWISASVVLLSEDINDGSVSVDVDEATITLGNTDEFPLFFTGGRMALPFGVFESHMVSDTLTLEISETLNSAVLLGFESHGFSLAGYAFNGATGQTGDDDTIDNGGLMAGYAWEGEYSDLYLNAGYISDISESDGIQDAVGSTIVDEVAAYTLFAQYNTGPFSLIAEYLKAKDRFDVSELSHNGMGAKLAAYNLEAGYTFDLAGHESTVAVGYQKTKQAADLELPEERISLGLSIGVTENTALNLEWAHDDAYTGGEDADSATAQLAVEF